MLRKNIKKAFFTKIVLLDRYFSNEPIKVILPKRVKRDNLSILKALASTVKQDYTSPHYKYFDDPYLIPNSVYEKRSYMLSKISGEDAAKFVNKQFPGPFNYNPAEPSIEALLVATEPKNSESTLEGLQERIYMLKCSLAHESYLKCLDANIDIPENTIEDLLDLLCFFNSKDPPDNNPSPDQVFLQHSILVEKNKPMITQRTWNDEGAAERVFRQLKPPSLRSQCSIIKGRVKYYNMDAAYTEYIQMKENKIILDDVETFNAVLGTIPYICLNPDDKWNTMNVILCDMNESKINANVGTFNAALTVVKSCKSAATTSQMGMLLAEMKKCNIEPSLYTWALVLNIVYNHQKVQNNILYKIVEYMKDKSLQIYEPADYEFFHTAMSCVLNNIKDLKLAYDLQNIVSASHTNLIGDGYRETVYYTNFFDILTTYENLDEVMVHYNKLVPNMYNPTFRIMDSIFDLIELQEGYQYLPKIYSDMVLMNFLKRRDLLGRLISLMSIKKHDDNLQEVFLKIIKNIILAYEQDAQNLRLKNKQELDGQTIGYMVIVVLNSKDFEYAWNIMKIYLTNKNNMNYFPSQKSLSLLCEECFHHKEADKAMELIKLMEDLGFSNAEKYLQRFEKEFPKEQLLQQNSS